MPFLHQGDAKVGLLEALDGKLRSWQEAGPGCGPIHGSLVHLVKQVCMGQEGLTGLGAAARRHNDGVQRECFTIRNMVKRSLAWQQNL